MDLRDSRKRKGNGNRQPLLLILGGGSDIDPKSLGHRLAHTLAEARNEYNWTVSPCAGINYDPANGEHLKLADDAVMDTLRYNVAAGDLRGSNCSTGPVNLCTLRATFWSTSLSECRGSHPIPIKRVAAGDR